MSEYQEAGRLLDAVLAGHRIEVMPEDPVGTILVVFKAHRDRPPEEPDDLLRGASDLCVDQVVKALETWLDYPAVTIEGDQE